MCVIRGSTLTSFVCDWWVHFDLGPGPGSSRWGYVLRVIPSVSIFNRVHNIVLLSVLCWCSLYILPSMAVSRAVVGTRDGTSDEARHNEKSLRSLQSKLDVIYSAISLSWTVPAGLVRQLKYFLSLNIRIESTHILWYLACICIPTYRPHWLAGTSIVPAWRKF